MLNIRDEYKAMTVTVPTIRGGTETQVLDTITSISIFGATSTLQVHSRGNVCLDLERDDEDEEF